MELVGALLSSSTPTTPAQAAAPAPVFPVEMARAMREAGMVKALTNALKLIDLDHPQVQYSLSFVVGGGGGGGSLQLPLHPFS